MEFHKTEKPLRGEITIPGDKSISHRSVMFGAISQGTTEITNFLQGQDCLSTISCFRKMGIEIENTSERILVHGRGLHGLTAPTEILDVGNSGTTTRLISGILAGQDFTSELTGDASIQKRPMGRIIRPLSMMDATIESIKGNGCAPLRISGHALKGIHYQSPVASAQVKSSILLAGLYADGKTSVTEPALSRNHTEIMLRSFGATVTSEGTTASILPDPDLHGQKIEVPGDISSAAYFIVAALIVPGSEILIKNCGINETRDGILRVCRAMGADITVLNAHTIRNAEELKVKESNRLDIMVHHLSEMGCDITGTEDGMIINGGKTLQGAVLDSFLDHRIAMSFAIASLACESTLTIRRADCVNISYPAFYQDLERLCR